MPSWREELERRWQAKREEAHRRKEARRDEAESRKQAWREERQRGREEAQSRKQAKDEEAQRRKQAWREELQRRREEAESRKREAEERRYQAERERLEEIERQQEQEYQAFAPYETAQDRRVAAGLAPSYLTIPNALADEDGSLMFTLQHFECEGCGRLATVDEALLAQQESHLCLPHLTWEQLSEASQQWRTPLRPALLQAAYGLAFEEATASLESGRILGLLDKTPKGYSRARIACEACMAGSREKMRSPQPPQRPRPRSGVAPRLRFQILKRDGFRCTYCGLRADDGAVLHVDHIIPVALGGTDDPENLTTSCDECNLGKSDREVV